MPEQINILIVEDESIVAMDLEVGLEQEGYHVVGNVDNYEDAVKCFKENSIDIVLMDINIHGEKDGIETAEALQKINTVPLIYLSAFTDAKTIERVKHTNPSSFLTKPYNIENVRIAIGLALHNFAEKKSVEDVSKVVHINQQKQNEKEHILKLKEYIFIKQNYKFIKFKFADILFAEAENNYVTIQTTEQKFLLRISLTDLLESLQHANLIRIHRSFAINIDAISSFDDQLIKISKYEIPIGRNYRQDFLNQFNLK